MAWGLGETGKGATQVASYLGQEAINTIASPFRFMGKYASGRTNEITKDLDRIANPHLYENVPFTGRTSNNIVKQKANLAKHFGKEQGKGFIFGSLLSGSMYGLSAYATDNPDNNAGDRMAHYGKHAIAGGVDVAADLALTGVGIGLATFGGPAGMAMAGGLQLFNMFAGFAGMDAGSIAMNVMNYADEQYDKAKTGPKFNMTQNTAMAMQRQIQNLHASGSNLGEMMHN
jgi:hypothetical protein